MKKAIVSVLLVLALLLTACGAAPKATLSMPEIYGEITASDVIELPAMMEINDARLLDLFGIDASLLDERAAYMAEVFPASDEILLFKAKTEDDAKTLVERLEAHRLQKANEMDGYLPDQYALINQAEVVRKGVYVHLVISADREQILQIVDGYIK